MNLQQQHRGQAVPPWLILGIAIAALVLATAALTAAVVGRSSDGPGWGGMMGRGYGGGMMGGSWSGAPANGPQPGESGFIAGTATAPRVISVLAGPGYAFTPAAISVTRDETVTFVVTTMGPLVHEFMVGPADAVAADKDGTPEVEDIGMMQSKSLTFHFDGDAPYAFACHEAGHYEAGMRGTIIVVG